MPARPRFDKRQALFNEMIEEIVAWDPEHPAAKAPLEFKAFNVFKSPRRDVSGRREINTVADVLHRVPHMQLGILRNFLLAKQKVGRWSREKRDRAIELVQKAIDTYPEGDPQSEPIEKEEPPHSDETGPKKKDPPKRKAPTKRAKPKKAKPRKSKPKK